MLGCLESTNNEPQAQVVRCDNGAATLYHLGEYANMSHADALKAEGERKFHHDLELFAVVIPANSACDITSQIMSGKAKVGPGMEERVNNEVYFEKSFDKTVTCSVEHPRFGARPCRGYDGYNHSMLGGNGLKFDGHQVEEDGASFTRTFTNTTEGDITLHVLLSAAREL